MERDAALHRKGTEKFKDLPRLFTIFDPVLHISRRFDPSFHMEVMPSPNKAKKSPHIPHPCISSHHRGSHSHFEQGPNRRTVPNEFILEEY